MDDLQKIEPVGTLEILSFHERRQAFRDGDGLVPASAGLVELHVRKPGGRPFTVYVTAGVLKEFMFPLRTVLAEDGPDDGEAERIREMLDLTSSDPDYRTVTQQVPPSFDVKDSVGKAQGQALREQVDTESRQILSDTDAMAMADAVYAGLGVPKEQSSGFVAALDRAVSESISRDADFAKLALLIKFKDDLEEALVETMFRHAGKWRDLRCELEDELRNPVVDAVYRKQAARHGGYVVSRECLIDMVKHLVRRVGELEKSIESRLTALDPLRTVLAEDGPEAVRIREILDPTSADPDFKIFSGGQRRA